MKNGITELVFILDESGSMFELKEDTIGGFNSMLNKQKKTEGQVLVTTVMFNEDIITVHDRVPLREVKPLTSDDYEPDSCTALLDAMGETINHISDIHKYIRKEDVPEHTLFVITTDGLENASRKFTAKDIKKLVTAKKEKGWEFLFLGANIDAITTAASYGISSDSAVEYCCDATGTALNFEAMNDAVCSVRVNGKVGKSWKAKIDADRESRK